MAGGTLARVELLVGDRPVHPLTAEQVIEAVQAGILPTTHRVELLHGVLVEKVNQGPPHVGVHSLLLRWLFTISDLERLEVRPSWPLRVPDLHSLPEPDLAVVERPDRPSEHPRSALFVIEVSHTSIRTDTKVKTALYGAAGVPEYWVVDVDARRVIVFTDPTADGYATGREHRTGPLEPRHLDVEPIDVAALFADLP